MLNVYEAFIKVSKLKQTRGMRWMDFPGLAVHFRNLETPELLTDKVQGVT